MKNIGKICLLMTLMFLVFSGCKKAESVDLDKFFKIDKKELSKDIKKYTYDANGIKVKFFAVLDKAGKIRTAFDACDVCGGKKGYRQSGSDVSCINCGRHFKITQLGDANVYGGGCWPSFLGFKDKGDSILISKKEIAAGAFRFR